MHVRKDTRPSSFFMQLKTAWAWEWGYPPGVTACYRSECDTHDSSGSPFPVHFWWHHIQYLSAATVGDQSGGSGPKSMRIHPLLIPVGNNATFLFYYPHCHRASWLETSLSWQWLSHSQRWYPTNMRMSDNCLLVSQLDQYHTLRECQILLTKHFHVMCILMSYMRST